MQYLGGYKDITKATQQMVYDIMPFHFVIKALWNIDIKQKFAHTCIHFKLILVLPLLRRNFMHFFLSRVPETSDYIALAHLKNVLKKPQITIINIEIMTMKMMMPMTTPMMISMHGHDDNGGDDGVDFDRYHHHN